MRSPIAALALLVSAATAGAQNPQSTPTNDAPNPYRTVEGWGKLPAGRVWGSLSAVDIDKDGTSIWVAERCGANDCVASQLDPVLKFDKDGNVVRSFGAGLIRSPHGIHVDREGNVWIVDCSCTGAGGGAAAGRGGRGGGAAGGGGRGAGGGAAGGPPAGGAPAQAPAPAPPMTNGHQVFKFSPEGKLLMTLGKPAGGRDTAYFFQPNDVVTALNGDIYVAEGHSDAQKTATARILKFDKTGKLLATWGTVVDSTTKDQPHSFAQPHALAFDSRGRLFVGDRSYNRIKIFDQTGKLLDTWYQFSRPSGIYIDAADNIYVADSESGSISPPHWAWLKGIRIGKISDGKVTAFIPDPAITCTTRLANVQPPPPASASSSAANCANGTSAAEGVAVDKAGNIYGAEVGPRALKKYVRNP